MAKSRTSQREKIRASNNGRTRGRRTVSEPEDLEEEEDEEDLEEDVDDREEDDEEEEEESPQGNAQRILQAMASDPEISAIIKARREAQASGKPYKPLVKLENDSDDEEDEEEEEELEEDDDEENDELVSRSSKKKDPLKIVLRSLSKDTEKKLNPLSKKVDMLMSMAEQLQDKEVKSQITQLSNKFPDFKKHRKRMAELSREHPKLSLEELYGLSKMRTGELNLEPPSTESERPGHTPRPRSSNREGKRKRGERVTRKDFRNRVAEALENRDWDITE